MEKSEIQPILCLNQSVDKNFVLRTCTRRLSHIGAHSDGLITWITDSEMESWFQEHNF